MVQCTKRAGSYRTIPTACQPLALTNFWKKLVQIHRETGYYFCDSEKLDNLGYIDGTYYLLDLDDFLKKGDVTLSEKSVAGWIEKWSALYKDYESLIVHKK